MEPDLESRAAGKLENINIEREALNLERKLVKNMVVKDFDKFNADYFNNFK